MNDEKTTATPKTGPTQPVVHTPGPWSVDEDTRPGMEWNRHIQGSDGLTVCFMAISGGNDHERDEANALLVSAAPELLAALEQALLWIEVDEMTHGRKFGAGNVAREAIAKATGQSVVSAGCAWHEGDDPVELNDTVSCSNCQRLLATRTCESCRQEFLDWEHEGYDDVLAGPFASSDGDLCCRGCIGSVERDIERAEGEADEGDWWYEPDDVP